MRGLRKQEDPEFERFFEIIQEAAGQKNAVFFGDSGEGRDIVLEAVGSFPNKKLTRLKKALKPAQKVESDSGINTTALQNGNLLTAKSKLTLFGTTIKRS